MPRPSPVTDAVKTLIEGEGHRAWSLDELLEEVKEQVSTANFSTVLRAIWTLEKRSLVNRVELGDGKARYEAARDHHEHVRCTQCGAVAEVPGCVVEEAAVIEARTGYAVRSHQLVFAGLCPDCRKLAVAPGLPATR
jgi:Fe2+ or Zn2+ uptake regulation protein